MISLVIPSFNSSKTIKACLDSILKSTLLPSEIIVVDDKSSDHTISIIEKLEYSKVRISIIKKKENSGPATARNVGAKHTKGEYIFFADSDTRLKKDAIEIAYKTIINNKKNISAVIGIYNENQSQGIIAEFKSFYYLFQMGRKGSIDYDAFSASCALIRREDFFKVSGYDEWFTPGLDLENEELGYRLVDNGFKIVLNPKVRCDHNFPSGIKLLRLFFKRTSLWMEMSIVRKKFTKALSTKSTGITSLLPILNLLILFCYFLNNTSVILFLFLSSLTLYLMMCSSFFYFYLKSKYPKILKMIIATYVSHLFISLGAIYGFLKVVFGKSLIFKKFSRFNLK